MCKKRKIFKQTFPIKDMQTKDVHISERNWKLLMKIKLEYGYKTVDEIIDSLLKIVPANELKEYLNKNKED